MFICSILTIAVLGSFVFGAAANADVTGRTNTAQVDGLTETDTSRGFGSAGGLGSTRR